MIQTSYAYYLSLTLLIMAEGYVLVTNKGARIYFAMFYLIISVVVMK